jgi:hypothetical protein
MKQDSISSKQSRRFRGGGGGGREVSRTMIQQPLLDALVYRHVVVVVFGSILGVGRHVGVDAVVARFGNATFTGSERLRVKG